MDLLPLARRVPRRLWTRALVPISWVVAARPPKDIRRWQRNAARATGVEPTPAQTRAAIASWARNLMESIQLHDVTPEEALERVRVDRERAEWLRAQVQARGAVVALPHQGSWDLSGAWACAYGMPVHTVAERLSPADYEVFCAERAAVGMTLYAHDDRRAVEKLEQAAQQHTAVCLVTDRAIARHGTVVDWPTPNGPEKVRIPVGSALIAQRAGVPLVPATSTFTPDGIHLVIGTEIEVGPGEDGIVAANQQLANWFSAQVQSEVTDWHMLQRFFDLVHEARGEEATA